MEGKFSDYEFCINQTLKNAKERISLLDYSDRKCIIEEYREWLKDDISKHTILLLREDPII